MRVAAPAKINPFLEVLGRRADGFHELDTEMVALEHGDELSVELIPGGGLELELTGPAASPDVPTDASNLALRGAQLALEIARAHDLPGAASGVRVRLDKRVPTRAGLGGGSSNAAAAALAVALLLDMQVESPLWHEAWSRGLARIGSDVTFFVGARATGRARCTGRGERLEALPAAPAGWHVVLVVPDVVASTPRIFAAWRPPMGARRRGAPSREPARGDLLVGTEARARAALRNDLERVALAELPALQPWRDLLSGPWEHFRMTGSGSTFFGLFRDERQARAAHEEVATEAQRRGLFPRAVLLTRLAPRAVHRVGAR